MNIIDLTQTINETMPVYPGTEKPSLINATTIKRDGFAEKLITMYSHTGTHIDAPAHMLIDGNQLDNFSIDKFIGRAIVIECNTPIISKTLIQNKINNLHDLDFILFNTGWNKKWGTDNYFNDFPILENEASMYISQLGLKGVGLDCISIDKVGSLKMTNHIQILKNDMIIIENLSNLDKLLNKEFIFSCLPLKIEDADGSPTRAIGILNQY